MDGFIPESSFSTLKIFFTFLKFFLFGGKIPCVELLVDPVWENFQELPFYDPNIDDYGERKHIPGENISMFIGLEDGSMSSVVYIGVPGFVSF